MNGIILAASMLLPAFYLDDVPCYEYASGHYECRAGEVVRLCKSGGDDELKCTERFIPCRDCKGV